MPSLLRPLVSSSHLVIRHHKSPRVTSVTGGSGIFIPGQGRNAGRVVRASPDVILGFGFGPPARAPPVSDPMPSGRRVVPGMVAIMRGGRFVSFARPAPPNPSFPSAPDAVMAMAPAGLPALTRVSGVPAPVRFSSPPAGVFRPAMRCVRPHCPRLGFSPLDRVAPGMSIPFPSVRTVSGPPGRIYRPPPLRDPRSRNIRSGEGTCSVAWGECVGKRTGREFGKMLIWLGAGVEFVHVLVGGFGPDFRHAGLDPASSRRASASRKSLSPRGRAVAGPRLKAGVTEERRRSAGPLTNKICDLALRSKTAILFPLP